MVTATEKNLEVLRHDTIMARHKVGSNWAEQVIEDGRNRAVWICGKEGTPPDPHIHPNFNEWWIVLDGKTRWQIGQYEPVVAEWGDIIMAPAGFAHDIRPWEGETSVRFGVTHPDGNHDIKGIVPARFIPIETDLGEPNLIHTRLSALKEKYGTDSSWKHIAILDQRNRALITHEMPGTMNRRYWHPGMDKWWVVIQGELEWSIANHPTVTAGPGDVVFVPAGTSHEIMTIGDEPSVRITITAPDIVHHYTDDPDAPKAPNG